MQNESNNMCMTVLLFLLPIVEFVRAEHMQYSDCGIRSSRRQPRSAINPWNHNLYTNYDTNPNPTSFSKIPKMAPSDSTDRSPKIMHGVPTLEGQFPWQVSLELLHPSYGFIGHWCGGVLIDRNWVLSAAHCIHNELFNLPLPALWTVVLGEYDRSVESGFEQRIPVDKIILHEKYHNFKHDLVLLKLTRPANTGFSARVKRICLPFADIKVNSKPFDPRPELDRINTNNKPLFFFDYPERPPDKGGGPTMATTNSSIDVVTNDDQVQTKLELESGSSIPEASFPDREDNYLRRLRQSSSSRRARGSSAGQLYHRPRTARAQVTGQVQRVLQQRRKAAARRSFTVRSDARTLVRNSSRAGKRRSSSRRGRFLYHTADFNIRSPWTSYDDNDDDDDNDVQGDDVENFDDSRRRGSNGGGGHWYGKRRRNDKFATGGLHYRNVQQRNDIGTVSVTAEETAGSPNVPNDGAGDAEGFSAIPDTTQYVDCLATGWGKSTIDDELTDILLQTKAPIQNSKKCEEAYGDFIKLHRGHLCAGNVDGTGGTCVGDSGGPLQCRITKHGPWILVGITSFGSGCAFKNYPDVYTKISFYRQWIVDTIREN
ncbi:uncharacterized protein LOC129740594 isoform X2 [Uranotaenia lowii]|uniref:uncharacterized protein LOC129740594 isoform X2 n=1 Tax=Uranotaenia lowii TaxID=190385 RepID=UPI00247B28B4|nr:uncharacterized protein LOC129740594 isoform X2 [Uranotaenia lowii]